ncbi:hypothetical protein G647_04726 [Cladophialophora carrionii CBS 160.54]|uniref:Carboxypeptidase n=1 Tax=Cladophialophora carrionii CBS 160.54 TaxID=1279043 RepID=V9DAF0_9EURO|nr:uncharacterized protein G647_04726 [Cladophialophora carrionii CBS 160.54]ETI22932.1 hypothetical protein G647_04726 [Cladophialophora carrionii CBS 160.54]
MWSQIWTAPLLVATLLLESVGATRQGGMLSEAVRRERGKRAAGPALNPMQTIETRAASHRFYSNDTKGYFVKSLPEMDFDLGELYSGVIPIDANNASRGLFFVFQPRVGTPVDEITIWLNGGPGCSSLEGFLQENGKFQWAWGQFTPTINHYSWVNLTNVLWVEYPVGVGFSIGESRATMEEGIAEEFNDFFLNFQTIFGISNFKIYVTGESYAGRYVPYIASGMLDRNDSAHFNLSGALTYNPTIGEFSWVQTQAVIYPLLQQNTNVMGYNKSFMATLAALDKSCGYADYRETYFKFPPAKVQPPKYFNSSSDADCDIWHSAYFAAYATNPCFNPYLISLQCPLQGDPLGFPSDLIYSYPGIPVYFNRTDVKRAIHAPVDREWSLCNGNPFLGREGGPQNLGDLSADPIQHVLPRVIDATQRVLISNSDLDFETPTTGTQLAIQNMTWGGKLGFQTKPSKPITITEPDLQYEAVFTSSGFDDVDDPQGTMGVQHFERGLMWAQTFYCGHMQPQFQPRSSYRHLQWLLGHIETL